FEGAGDDLFRVAEPVDGRGVDPVDAGVHRLVDRGDGVAVLLRAPGELPARPADGPRPESDRSDEHVGVAQTSRFHHGSPAPRRRRLASRVLHSWVMPSNGTAFAPRTNRSTALANPSSSFEVVT